MNYILHKHIFLFLQKGEHTLKYFHKKMLKSSLMHFYIAITFETNSWVVFLTWGIFTFLLESNLPIMKSSSVLQPEYIRRKDRKIQRKEKKTSTNIPTINTSKGYDKKG